MKRVIFPQVSADEIPFSQIDSFDRLKLIGNYRGKTFSMIVVEVEDEEDEYQIKFHRILQQNDPGKKVPRDSDEIMHMNKLRCASLENLVEELLKCGCSFYHPINL